MRGTVRGIRVKESTGAASKKIAEETRAKREADLLAQSIYGRRATATFAEAALSYLENGGNKPLSRQGDRAFGTTPLAKIDRDAIDKGARKVGRQRRRGSASSTLTLRRCARIRGITVPFRGYTAHRRPLSALSH
jgi:hypothetical protein